MPIAKIEVPMAPIKFEFQSYEAMELVAKHPLIFFAFEGQPDSVISPRFPEVDDMRTVIENNTGRVEDATPFFPLVRGDLHFPGILIYIGQMWRREKRRKSRLVFGSIDFYRLLGIRMFEVIERLRNMGLTEATIVLPGRFHPKNLQKDPHGEREEEIFVRTIVESIVAANGSLGLYQATPKPRIAAICFTHFGNHEQTATHFFNRAVGTGEEIGKAVEETRKLILLPPSDKTPISLANRLLHTTIAPRNAASPRWRTVKKHGYGTKVKASILYGAEGLSKAGFGLISAVGRGSADEPCLLKLHYRPERAKEGMKKLSLLGKGVIMDTGGMSVKTDGGMTRMHYDMAGAATVAGVFRLAVEHDLSLEIIALLPLVENAIGPRATRLHDVARAYDGQTVEITNTDSEGRLILADALSYSEKNIRPDATVTVATLCDMAEFGPDFLKVMVNSPDLERRVKIAEGRSHEKMILFPPLEHFSEVEQLFTGTISDLKNETGYHYHTGMIFLSHFFQWDPSPWLYLDVAATMDTDADLSGAGPGFGVRFLWQFVKQFA